MPRKTDNIHSNTTPHSDGKYESIINDPTATQGSKAGVFMDREQKKQHPLQLSNTNNKDMKEFEQLLRGDALDEL
ncbi:hypothetical protein ACFSCZ_13540 [Siminovitchia sediminis]|uniref:Uncharacterized protein n=1 Tax=Siminovitchia sediminis TaxID=1274353 RepID=A0ABW4KIG2_9BACI